MGIQKEVIEKFFKEKDWTYKDEERENGTVLYKLPFAFKNDRNEEADVMLLVILEEPSESGYEFIAFRVLNMLDGNKVKESKFLPELMKYVLQKNYQKKIGSWALDPDDGDLYVSCVLPLEDSGQLTNKQMGRICNNLLKSAKEGFIDLSRLLNTGVAELKVKLIAELAMADQKELVSSLAKSEATIKVLREIQDLIRTKNWEAIESLLSTHSESGSGTPPSEY